MPNLHELATAVRQKYPSDPDVIELERAAATICACAHDMLDAIDIATREENARLTMAASLTEYGEDGEALSDDQLQSDSDAAAAQGEIAELAAREAEAFGRELAMKILHHTDE